MSNKKKLVDQEVDSVEMLTPGGYIDGYQTMVVSIEHASRGVSVPDSESVDASSADEARILEKVRRNYERFELRNREIGGNGDGKRVEGGNNRGNGFG